MKRVYVKEEWCLGCHLCEYNCAFANSGEKDMAEALKGKPIFPRIHIEEGEKICYAVSCRHCTDPMCIKSCIAGAISKIDGVVHIDQNKCVGCLTCVLVCQTDATQHQAVSSQCFDGIDTHASHQLFNFMFPCGHKIDQTFTSYFRV